MIARFSCFIFEVKMCRNILNLLFQLESVCESTLKLCMPKPHTWVDISFTVWKGIWVHIYPAGVRNFRPAHPFKQNLIIMLVKKKEDSLFCWKLKMSTLQFHSEKIIGLVEHSFSIFTKKVNLPFFSLACKENVSKNAKNWTKKILHEFLKHFHVSNSGWKYIPWKCFGHHGQKACIAKSPRHFGPPAHLPTFLVNFWASFDIFALLVNKTVLT